MIRFPAALAALVLAATAATAAEDPEREVVKMRIETNHGAIVVDLWPEVAPETVANFVGLATGEKAWTDPETEEEKTEPFYDGLVFHRVIDNFMIQGGCPLGTGRAGPGYTFADEINAEALGLDDERVIADGRISRTAGGQVQRYVQTVLGPELIEGGKTEADLRADPDIIRDEFFSRAAEWSLKDLYEANGYEYSDELPSVPPTEGRLAMANSGPNTNGSQFFINLADTPWLAGLHTVFGEVSEGLDVVQEIGQVRVDRKTSKPLEPVKIISVHRVESDE